MDIIEIWAVPSNAVVPDVSAFAAARDMERIYELSDPFGEAFSAASERAAEDSPPLIDVKPTWTERLLDVWDGVIDTLMFFKNRKAILSEARPFQFQLPVGQTHPTMELSFEYEEMFGETRRFRDVLSAPITAVRGAPFRIVFDTDRMDDALEDDHDVTGFAQSLDGITQYWPPVGNGPAIALYEMQEDGGLAIDVALVAHSASAHVAMMERLVQDFAGRLVPMSR